MASAEASAEAIPPIPASTLWGTNLAGGIPQRRPADESPINSSRLSGCRLIATKSDSLARSAPQPANNASGIDADQSGLVPQTPIGPGAWRNFARDVRLAFVGETPCRQSEIGCQNKTRRYQKRKRYPAHCDAPPTQLKAEIGEAFLDDSKSADALTYSRFSPALKKAAQKRAPPASLPLVRSH
jgi:hypothetical protein